MLFPTDNCGSVVAGAFLARRSRPGPPEGRAHKRTSASLRSLTVSRYAFGIAPCICTLVGTLIHNYQLERALGRRRVDLLDFPTQVVVPVGHERQRCRSQADPPLRTQRERGPEAALSVRVDIERVVRTVDAATAAWRHHRAGPAVRIARGAPNGDGHGGRAVVARGGFPGHRVDAGTVVDRARLGRRIEVDGQCAVVAGGKRPEIVRADLGVRGRNPRVVRTVVAVGGGRRGSVPAIARDAAQGERLARIQGGLVDGNPLHDQVGSALCHRHGHGLERDQNGRTPLHEAAAGAHLNWLNALIEAGADPNIRDKDGRTPLYDAESSPACVDALIVAGANANTWDKEGNSPLIECRRSSRRRRS